MCGVSEGNKPCSAYEAYEEMGASARAEKKGGRCAVSYKTPAGRVRVWTYLPEEVVRQLKAVAARHRRRLPEELALAVEQYVEREESGIVVAGRPWEKGWRI